MPVILAMEIMERDPESVRTSTTILAALKILERSHLSSLPVVDEIGRVIGIVSEYDIIDALSSRQPGDKTAFDAPVPYSPPIVVRESSTLQDIERLIVKTRLRRLPVVDGRARLKGMISRRSLIKFYIMKAESPDAEESDDQ